MNPEFRFNSAFLFFFCFYNTLPGFYRVIKSLLAHSPCSPASSLHPPAPKLCLQLNRHNPILRDTTTTTLTPTHGVTLSFIKSLKEEKSPSNRKGQ